MAKILNPIPASIFELIGDSICNILQEELNNQVLLQYDESICTNIYLERMTPLNESEYPAIIVQMIEAECDPSKVTNGDCLCRFNIDVYFQADDSQDERADAKAARLMKKTAGLIRQILKNPQYRTLDFATGSIGRTVISRLQIVDSTKQDSNNTIMGRLTFEVFCNDNYELKDPVAWSEFETQVKIGETNLGSKYVLGI